MKVTLIHAEKDAYAESCLSPAGIDLDEAGLKKVGGRERIVDVKGKGWILCLKCVVEDDRGKGKIWNPNRANFGAGNCDTSRQVCCIYGQTVGTQHIVFKLKSLLS